MKHAFILIICLAAVAAPAGNGSDTGPGYADLWRQVREHIDQGRLSAADATVERILVQARAEGDAGQWTRALIDRRSLRSALDAPETALQELRATPWPTSALENSVLEMHYAHALMVYQRRYAGDIRRRDEVAGADSLAVANWGLERFIREIDAALARAWAQREQWEDGADWREYLEAGNYPDGVRGTMHDAVAYMWTGHLADAALWSPRMENAAQGLELEPLLTAPLDTVAAARADPHPLQRIGRITAELRAWHLAAGRREAALEAELENLRRIHRARHDRADRERIRRYLETRLHDVDAGDPWWSLGQWQLARFLEQESGPDHLLRAHMAADRGARRHPDSVGGRLCALLRDGLAAASFQIQGMAVDAPGQRTIRIRHRNLPRLHFRAWRYDLREVWEEPAHRRLGDDLDAALRRDADLAWTVELPPTPDYADHVTWTGLPPCPPGGYLVTASAAADPQDEAAPLQAIDLVISGLLIEAQPLFDSVVFAVRSAADGAPVADAELRVRLRGHGRGERTLVLRTDDGGRAPCPAEGDRWMSALAAKGDDTVILGGVSTSHRRDEPARRSTFLYTDRAVYRPGQTVHWKVVAYDAGEDREALRTAPRCTLTVALQDANHRAVASREVVTNDFGSASGTFDLPADGLLGRWWIETDPDVRTAIRVEQYKRPTFEVAWEDPAAPLRLGSRASVAGRADYLFGMPVGGADVEWRVRRVVRRWQGWGDMFGGPGDVIAKGEAVTGDDGRFTVAFVADAPAPRDDDQRHIYSYTLEADVTDAGGETRSASRIFHLGSASIVAEVTAAANFVRPGRPDSLVILRTDLNRAPRPGAGRWTLYAKTAPDSARLPSDLPVASGATDVVAYATPGDSLRPRWEGLADWRSGSASWPRGPVVAEGVTQHGDDGRAVAVVVAPTSGVFEFVYETADAHGRTWQASHAVLAGGDGRSGALNLPLVLEQETRAAAVGDTARFLVHSGLADAPIRLQIFVGGEQVRDDYLPAGHAAGTLVAVPVEAKMHRGLEVHASLISRHEVLQGARTVLVPWDEKRLQVSFAGFRDRLRPGRHETFTVTVTGPDAAAAAGEVLAFMYDRSLDAIARLQAPDPLRLRADRRHVMSARTSQRLQSPFRRRAAPPPPELMPLLLPDRLLAFPGSQVDLGLDGRGRLSKFGVDPELARRLAAEGVTLVEAFDVEGAEYMVEVKSAVMAKGVDAAVFERYAIDSVEDALSRQAGVVRRAGELYVRGGRSGDVIMSLGLPPPPIDTAEVDTRRDFSETAFFLPHVELDGDGRAVISFQAPESVTEWKLLVHALTPDLMAGSAERSVRTVKDLLVRPYLPRFLREGDAAELRIVVGNTGRDRLEGRVQLELEDPITGRDLAADFGLHDAVQRFAVEAGGSTALVFPVRAPRSLGDVVVRAVGVAGDLSDGEQRALPVLPGRTHLLQSRFAALGDSARRELRFADMARPDPTRENEQLVITVDTQLLGGVVRALPYLVQYPYECVEQTLNRYLGAGILSAVYGDHPQVAAQAARAAGRGTRFERWDAPDPNRRLLLEETPWLDAARGGESSRPLHDLLQPEVAADLRERSLAKLTKAQNADGGFPWFPGGRSSPYITLYVLMGLARGAEFGVEPPAEAAAKAWRYLRAECGDPDGDEDWPLSPELATLLCYVLSCYPDEVVASAGFTADWRRDLLDLAWRHRLEHVRLTKAHLALALHRDGRTGDARELWASLMDAAKSDPDLGVYWAPEDRAWLWYSDTVEGHAFILRASAEIAPDDPRRSGLAQWLLLNKHLNQWKSTRATAEALYALVHHMQGEGTLARRESVRLRVGDHERVFVSDPGDPAAGTGRLVIDGDEIDEATMHTVVAERETPGLAFASATWRFSTERAPAAADGDLLAVTRRLFRRDVMDGLDVLTPLEPGAMVTVGDEIEIQLEITARHAAEYVHLRDPRAAGCEPLSVRSGHRWDRGLGWYEEVRDSGANFFFARLPAGTYTLRHRLRAVTAGAFQVQPAVLQSMYAPEFGAHSAGAELRIAP